MNLLKKSAAILLCITILLSFPIAAKAKTKSGCIFNSKTYTHQTQFDKHNKYQGVDLSKHNGTVDFAKMKKAGVKYVILRAGYRGYASEGTLNKDIKFDTYINAAIKAGLSIGIYFYSQAVTTSEAQAEAKYTIKIIKNYKKYIDLPVAFDYEFAEVSSGRFDKRWHNGTLNKKKCTAIAKSFCDYVTKSGYKAMIYANKSFLSEVIDGKELSKTYPIWMANYTNNTTYNGTFYIWQFTSTGKISGVSGSVDANFLYSTSGLNPVIAQFKVSKIANQEYTGSAIKPEVNVAYNTTKLTLNTDYKVTYANNKKIGKASVTITGINNYKEFPEKTVYFKIIPERPDLDLELVKRGTDSLKVKWNKVDGADGYRISYRTSTGWVNFDSTTDTEFEMKDLAPSRTYKWVIQTYNNVDKAKYYSHASQYTRLATKPARVEDLKVTHRTGISINLKWKKQSGATKYIVYKYDKKEDKYIKYCEIEGGTNNTVKVKDLIPNTQYKFRVRAVKEAENGKIYNGAPSKTTTDYTTPKSPVLDTAVSNSKKHITMSWEKIYSAQGYQVMWSTSKTFAKNNKTKKFKGRSSTKNTFEVAKSNKMYYVKVRSYRVRGEKTYYSPWSNKIEVKVK